MISLQKLMKELAARNGRLSVKNSKKIFKYSFSRMGK